MRLAGALVLILLLLGPLTARAESEAEGDAEPLAYSRDGGWIGVGGFYADEQFTNVKGTASNSGGVMFRGGYRGYSWLGVELLGEVLTGFEKQKTGKKDRDVDGFAVTVNGKVFAPLGRIEPFLIAGIGFLDIDQDGNGREDDFAFRFGGGADFYLTPHVVWYVEAAYMVATGTVSNFDYVSYGSGFSYRF